MLFAKETSNVGGSILDFEYVRFEMPFRHSDSYIKYETYLSLEDEGKITLERGSGSHQWTCIDF